MAEPIPSREGNASVQYQLVLDQQRTIELNPDRIQFNSADIHDSVTASGNSAHAFVTDDAALLESFKELMSNADPVIKFRLGFGAGANMFWLPWQRHIVTNYTAKFTGLGLSGGHYIAFNTSDEFVRAERPNRTLAHKGTIAAIVKAIAEKNKLKAIIEPTAGEFVVYQSFVDDTRFIRERLLPRALSTRGRGGYYCFIKDDVLHFHTQDYQSTARALDFYNGYGKDFMASDNSQLPALWDSGLAGVAVQNHNPFTGAVKTVKSDPNAALKLADTLYQFSTVAESAKNVMLHQSFNPELENNARAQYQYLSARAETFNGRLIMDKTIEIRHGDLLNLSLVQQATKASSHSGFYYVVSASHRVKKQAVRSVYMLARGEIRGQDQSTTVQSVDHTLVSSSAAPGEVLNLSEIQSSEATKGAGKNTSVRAFTALTDANTGTPKA